MISPDYPDTNFNQWSSEGPSGGVYLLNVNGCQIAIMRWDLSEFAGNKVKGSGLLELTTHSIEKLAGKHKDFGMVRVVEILAGEPKWDQSQVTFNSFTGGLPIDDVLNTQMIIDVDITSERGGKNLITLSNSVLQRMLDGKTLGIALRPLGAVNASFFPVENGSENYAPKLHCNFFVSSEQ